ncbi:MAG: hypothetical protein K2M04_03695 [Muribaculaceae bacterium]|nr:hypothetical protein [Muribaculaceae bacterium]
MKTFTYYPKSVLKDNLTTIVLSLLMIVVPIVYPFGIRIGTARILGPLPTAIIIIAIGLYLLYNVTMRIRNARVLASGNCTITVNDDVVTYPVIKNGRSEQNLLKIPEITNTRYDEDDGILTVTMTNGNKIEFDVDYFDSPDKLKEFEALLQK